MNRFIVAAIVCVVLGVGGWLLFRGGGLVDFNLGDISPTFVGDAPAYETDYVVPPLEGDYRNEEFRFILTMPEGFTSAELPPDDGGGKAILFQDSGGNGIQIYVTPYADDTRVLTADMIRASIPDMQVADVQEVEIGRNNRGVAFLSDNDAFSGSSREVWFVFRGNLYQISTYERLDPLLRAMFSTWKFF